MRDQCNSKVAWLHKTISVYFQFEVVFYTNENRFILSVCLSATVSFSNHTFDAYARSANNILNIAFLIKLCSLNLVPKCFFCQKDMQKELIIHIRNHKVCIRKPLASNHRLCNSEKLFWVLFVEVMQRTSYYFFIGFIIQINKQNSK